MFHTSISIRLQYHHEELALILIMDCLQMQVFPSGMDKDAVVLYAARASRVENQDAIDASIVNMLSDPKEVLWLTHFHKNLAYVNIK